MPGPADLRTDSTGGADATVSLSEAKAAIASYTNAVQRRLRPSLDAAIAARDAAYAGLAEAERMSRALDALDAAAEAAPCAEEEETDEAGDSPPLLQTRVNIGEEFYADAAVARLEPVIVDVGLGVLVEMSREEARVVVKTRREGFEKEAEKQNQRIAGVQAHLKGVVKHLEELTTETALEGGFAEFREGE